LRSWSGGDCGWGYSMFCAGSLYNSPGGPGTVW
jgi:hypothetical protein